MLTVDLAMSDLPKKINYGEGGATEYDLREWRDVPIEKWPHPLKMDFWLNLTIFYNLHLIPKKEIIKYMHIGEEVDADLMDLLEYL